MNRLSAQVQMYIGIAAIAVIAVAVVMLLILPQFQAAADLDRQIAAEETSLTEAKALLARRQSAKVASAANEAELLNIANRVPDSPQLPAVIIEIQDVANQAGVSFEAITPASLAPGTTDVEGEVADFSVVPVAIQVRGDWSDVIDFYRRLARLDRGVRIVTSSFTFVPESEDEPSYLDAQVGIEVYVMAAATTTTSPESSATTATAPAP